MRTVRDGILFHNVVDLEETKSGLRMWRMPQELAKRLDKRQAAFGTGVELRFRIEGEKAIIRLRAEAAEEAQVAYIYFGSFQGGWMHSAKVIKTEETVIEIPKPANLIELKQIAKEQGLPFDPEVVRILLPYCPCYYLGSDGVLREPDATQLPAHTYLAYGSSITHGSLALAPPYTYPARIAQRLGCDYLNQGYAGAALLEAEVAEFLVSRDDWSFASVEMGINMLDDFDLDMFEERLDRFTAILAKDPRPVFATGIYGFNGEGQKKAMAFRKIARCYAGERLIFIEGTTLLNQPAYISQDMVHPTLEGIEQIAMGWEAFMRASGQLPEDVGSINKL